MGLIASKSMGDSPQERIRKRLRRWERPGDLRYLTFSCFQRLPLLGSARVRDDLASAIAEARDRSGFKLVAWVIMPEHVHLLVRPDLERATVPDILRAIKQQVARRAIRDLRQEESLLVGQITLSNGRARFWQAGGGFDRNIRDGDELVRTVSYIHNNPVKRGLVESPADWAWSSARWYEGRREGQIPIDLHG